MKNLNVERIMQLFLFLTDLPDRELYKWVDTCKRSARYMEGRIKDHVDIIYHSEDLCAAAAACAYYEYMTLEMQKSKGIGEEVRIGGVSVKNTSSRADAASDAKETRDYYISRCAGLLKNEPSFFISIKEDTDEG